MWVFFVALVVAPRARAQETVEGLEQALFEIQDRFPAEVASNSLYRAALDGVARHLGEVMGIDDNKVLTQGEYAAHMAWLQGHRDGIGADFSILSGRGLLITEVFSDGPADRGGLTAGDLVVSMNDHPFIGLRREAIHFLVRRAKRAETVFDVRRKDGSIRRVTVERGGYALPPIRSNESADQTPVARIPFFGKGTAAALKAFLEQWEEASAVVIDLRDNEGGTLEEVVSAADLFLDPGSIVVHKGRHRSELEPITADTLPVWVRNVVVLINQGTLGVAEAFAAALAENGRCVLVGTRSGGRAVDTSVYPAGRGFVLQVADTYLATPSGSSWSERGLAPNVVVESTGLIMPVGPVGSPPDLQRETAIRLISTGVGR
jgi:carboxyl-terminal processing protease